MIDVLRREGIYLWYYFLIQLEQIFPYWALGILLGSFVSVFGRGRLEALFLSLGGKRLGLLGVIPASLIGIASPLCMYGTIPLAASFSQRGMRHDWLASFMMSSMLLNPQLLFYSAVLGAKALAVRFASCLLCGILAGLCVHFFYRDKPFFNFAGFMQASSRDTHANPLWRLVKNIGRNLKATGVYFFLGVLLSAVYQRYVPKEAFAGLFGSQRGFGVLLAATVGVPLYVCGGGTIPLLQQWLLGGMSLGAAAAFMLTGPATKITNLGAVKIVLGAKRFLLYLLYVLLFSLITGLFIDWFV